MQGSRFGVVAGIKFSSSVKTASRCTPTAAPSHLQFFNFERLIFSFELVPATQRPVSFPKSLSDLATLTLGTPRGPPPLYHNHNRDPTLNLRRRQMPYFFSTRKSTCFLNVSTLS